MFAGILQPLALSCYAVNFAKKLYVSFCCRFLVRDSRQKLQPLSPAILPEDPEKVEIAAPAGVYGSAAEELYRVVPVHG